jgi:N-acetylmuramoyl-L-alanine amidase
LSHQFRDTGRRPGNNTQPETANLEKRPAMVIFLIWCCVAVGLLGSPLSRPVGAGDFKVAIDIGHTIRTPGAISARGVPEYLFNRNIAFRLYQKLRTDGRFRGSFIINPRGDDLALAARAAIANRSGAALLISIHHDSVQPRDLSHWWYQGKSRSCCDRYAGYSIFYSEKNGSPRKSRKFAEILGSEMLGQGFCPTLHHAPQFTGGDKELVDRVRGIYKYNRLVVLKRTEAPAVLFECGVIKNRYEEKELGRPGYQRQLVKALFQAIIRYFNQKYTQ